MPVNSKMKVFKDMENALDKVDALWGGTSGMRDAGKKYLPMESGEDTEDYQNRLKRSTLTNIFKKTVNGAAGRVFSEHARIDNPGALSDFADNVDMEGRDFNRFAYDLARFTLKDGIRFILLDAPSAEGVTNASEERKAGIRPYWVEVDVRNVLGLKTMQTPDGDKIIQFRMLETVSEEEDEFSDVDVKQIRVIEPNQVRLYREEKKGVWKLHDTIQTSYNMVPVVPVFSDRQGFMRSKPPFEDIADLNIEHWQKSSDQSNILHVARCPILHWSGYRPQVDAQGNNVDIVVSPNTLAKSADPNAKLSYVEHSGAAIGSGREDLLDIEARMVAMGAEFAMKRKTGNITATERIIDESADISELEAFAINLKDSLTLAVEMTAELAVVAFNGEVFINTDLSITPSPVNVAEVVKMRGMRDISREGMFEILNAEWGTSLSVETETSRMEDEPESVDTLI